MRRATALFGWGAARIIRVLLAGVLVCCTAASSAAADSPAVIRTIPVGQPVGVSSDGTHVWVTSVASNTVSEIEASSGTVIRTIRVGEYPVSVSSDGTYVWVTNWALGTDSTVSEIEASSGTVIRTIRVGDYLQGVSSDGTHVWVANSASDTVSEIEASSGTVIRTIRVGYSPEGVSSDGTHVWVANSASDTVSEIEASSGTVIRTIPVGENPDGVSSDGTYVWVTNSGANSGQGTVSEIEAFSGTVIRTFPVGDNPQGVSSDGTHVWVANRDSNTVSEIGSGSPSKNEYVALGDSYSAGEGDGSYGYGSGTANNHCDRSPYAYGPLLDASLSPASFSFVACSGAITQDFLDPNAEGNINSTTNAPEPPQFDALNASTEDISWTIGGNDIGFGELGEKCFYAKWTIFKVYGKAGCALDKALVSSVHKRIEALGGVGSATTPGHEKIHSILSLLLTAHADAPNATIYVAGYPRLFGAFTNTECGIGTFLVTKLPGNAWEYVSVKITSGDAAWLDTVANELDATIASAVDNARTITGASILYVDPNPEFETHRLCDSSTSWIHDVEGEATYKPKKLTYLFPGSMHPTATGQEDGYAAAFSVAGL